MTFKFSQRERGPQNIFGSRSTGLSNEISSTRKAKKMKNKTKQNIKPEGKIRYVHSRTTLFNKVNNTKI